MLSASRALAASVIAASFLTAPLQCARRNEPDRRIEDDPAEAIYLLAEKFKAENKPDARADTLRFLIARYPTSRFVDQARADLGALPPK